MSWGTYWFYYQCPDCGAKFSWDFCLVTSPDFGKCPRCGGEGVLKGESLSQEERRLGVSLLLINTAKGAQVFDTLPLQRKRCELKEAVAADPALRTPTAMSPDRARFFEALEHEPFRQVCGRFLSMLQPREKPAVRPLKELLRLPWGKKEKK